VTTASRRARRQALRRGGPETEAPLPLAPAAARAEGGDDAGAAADTWAPPLGRWSTHFDQAVAFTVRGVAVQLAQDPGSDNIGHSVWDVSRAAARHLEADPWWRRELARHRRVVELGAGVHVPLALLSVWLSRTDVGARGGGEGCGLVGVAAAILGGHVTLTDLPSVVPLLQRNAHAALTSPGTPCDTQTPTYKQTHTHRKRVRLGVTSLLVCSARAAGLT
jgi:hypothetical protein